MEKEKATSDARRDILALPFGSMVFVDVTEQDGAKLRLEQMRLTALISLMKAYPVGSEEHKKLKSEYMETFTSFMTTTYFAISEMFGPEIVGNLADPCWEIGYNPTVEKVYLLKICPKRFGGDVN